MSQENDQETEAVQPDWMKNYTPAPGPVRGNPNWYKGMPSPNPHGRKASFGSPRTQVAKMLQDNVGDILDVMIQKAKEGDSAAAQLVLSRVMAPLRADSGRVKFDFDPELPIAKQIEQVLAAVASGAVSPEVGQTVISAVSKLADARALEELETRITLLEAKQV